MSVSINISVGWPKPKNFTAETYVNGSDQYVKLNWDPINFNSIPFTLDTSGNGGLNVKYRIIESYLYKELKYEVDGTRRTIETVEPGNIIDINENYYTDSLGLGVSTEKCYEIQAIYNFPRNENELLLKETDIIVSEKTSKIRVKLISDKYCAQRVCQMKLNSNIVKNKNKSSKALYSNYILNGVNATSTLSKNNNNYRRGFLNFNVLNSRLCLKSKYFNKPISCENNSN
jgi:hypothetical protein